MGTISRISIPETEELYDDEQHAIYTMEIAEDDMDDPKEEESEIRAAVNVVDNNDNTGERCDGNEDAGDDAGNKSFEEEQEKQDMGRAQINGTIEDLLMVVDDSSPTSTIEEEFQNLDGEADKDESGSVVATRIAHNNVEKSIREVVPPSKSWNWHGVC